MSGVKAVNFMQKRSINSDAVKSASKREAQEKHSLFPRNTFLATDSGKKEQSYEKAFSNRVNLANDGRNRRRNQDKNQSRNRYRGISCFLCNKLGHIS